MKKKPKVEKDKITSFQESFFVEKDHTREEIADDALAELCELFTGVKGEDSKEMAVRCGILIRTLKESDDKTELVQAAYSLGQIVQEFRVLRERAIGEFRKAITTHSKKLDQWTEFKNVVDKLRAENPLRSNDVGWLMQEAAERLDIDTRTAYRLYKFGGLD